MINITELEKKFNSFNKFNLVFASLFFSLMTLCVKNIDKRIPIYELVLFRSLLSLIITLFIGGSIITNYLNDINVSNQISYKKAEKEIEDKIQKATFVIDSPLPVIKLRLNKKYGDFHVVGGSFRVKGNSYSKLEQLKAVGYKDARRIGQNNFGLYQVAYASYDTRAAAKNALSNNRSKHNINAWLLYKDVN